MSVRMGVGIVCLGAVVVGCGTAAGPAEQGAAAPVSSAPSAPDSPSTEPSEPPAPARGVSWVRVDPGQGAPGSVVSLDVACLDSLGVVRSPALDIGALSGDPDGHQPWHQFGTATVRADAPPGQYQISATCGAEKLSAAFTVIPVPPR